MTPEQFREHGHRVIDWIADYYERIETFPVLSQAQPGAAAGRAARRTHPSTASRSRRSCATWTTLIMPGITHWQHPSFFAYFPANASGPGDPRRSAGLGPRRPGHALGHLAGCHRTRDARARLAGRAARPARTVPGNGVIQHTASDAALVALLAALHRASDGAHRAQRCPQWTVRGVHVGADAFLGREGLPGRRTRRGRIAQARRRPRDAGRPPGASARADRGRRRRRASRRPWWSLGRAPPASARSIRPAELAEIAHEYGAWLHVDAAWAGVAAVCPELRWLDDGVELADSYCTNPHKWLLTNFDCDAFWVADRAALLGALSILPEYLRNRGDRIRRGDRLPRLARAARAPLPRAQAVGGDPLVRRTRGFASTSAAHVALAQEFASWVAADERFELVAPHPLSLVTFRLRGGRRCDPGAHGAGERVGRAVPDAHGGQRRRRAAHGDRLAADAAPPRRGGLGGTVAPRGLSLTGCASCLPARRVAICRPSIAYSCPIARPRPPDADGEHMS